MQRYGEAGIQLILCTPAPYDEYEPTPIQPLKGGYAMMAAVEKYVSDKGTLTPYFQRIIENYADNLDNKDAISAQADLIYEEDILPEKRRKHE